MDLVSRLPNPPSFLLPLLGSAAAFAAVYLIWNKPNTP